LTAVALAFALNLTPAGAAGLLSGATTNTPSLAAAVQVLGELFPAAAGEEASTAGMAYAVTYPFGIMGILLCMLLIRLFFRIRPAEELEILRRHDAQLHPPLLTQTFVLTNPNLAGLSLGEIAADLPPGLVFSRIREPGGVIQTALPETRLQEGMLLHAVGRESGMHSLRSLVGPLSEVDLHEAPGPLGLRVLLVTQAAAVGKTVPGLGLTPESGVTVTRIVRSGVEFTPGPGVRLHYGDKLTAVGEDKDLDRAASVLGNSPRALEESHIMPIFLGILFGIVLGSIPISFPGLPYPVKLGLAGGPLLAAIILSRVNHFAGIIWYLPTGANFILREMGIALFLACVGLGAGAGFVQTLTEGNGLLWMAAGTAVTFFPLLAGALLARVVLRYDYATICGLLAGSMTDPPALAFSVRMLGSDAPSSVYATVYPLTMILRILFAQLAVLGLFYLL
jgi:putative transport protein